MIMMMMIMMARTEYIHRPVKATTNIHYKICQNYRFKMRGKWYACDHSPQIVVKNEGATVIWSMQTPSQTSGGSRGARPPLFLDQTDGPKG